MGFVTDQERALADLLVSVMHAREQEGARISRILHDEVGQVLSAVGLQLDLLRMDLDEEARGHPARIGEIQKVLEQAVGQVRDLSYELNPSVVERTGLQFALDRLIGRHRKTFRGSIRLMFDPTVRVDLERGTALFKIAEQALENAVQYSQATQVEVLVKSSKQGAVLEIRDNGIGFASEHPPGLGIQMMRYHADKAGLRFSIASEPERGTIVKAICRVLTHLSGSSKSGTSQGVSRTED